jgi:mannose-6-phosphate isomerase-like protein (cupin superfamily)
MDDLQNFISSGILELYVLGEASVQEKKMVEEMAVLHPEIRLEIEEIEQSLERYAMTEAITPDPTVKPLLLATIDYMDRLKNGEIVSVPPVLAEKSSAHDYAQWLNRADMVLPPDADDIFARIISATNEMMTAIVWIKQMAPQEVHDHEHERFLILEGSCDIYVENIATSLSPGDYFAIPLHKDHRIVITSDVPCKAILQRIAA